MAVHCAKSRGWRPAWYPARQSILDLPDPVDLAAILVPAQFITSALKECGKRGIRAAIDWARGQVLENAGFELPLADEIRSNPPPSVEELLILREEVDKNRFYI